MAVIPPVLRPPPPPLLPDEEPPVFSAGLEDVAEEVISVVAGTLEAELVRVTMIVVAAGAVSPGAVGVAVTTEVTT